MSPEARINQINFDLLFNKHPLPMWIYDLQSLAFLEVNDAAVKKYGYSRKKFLSMTLKNIRPKEDVARLIKDVSKKRPALQQSRNWKHKLKSGKVIDVEITSHTINYNGRKAALVTARDITDQKNAEEKINRLNKVYSVLSEVNQTIVRTRNAKELFNSICRIAVNNGGYEMAWIGMLNKEDNKVKVIASAGVTNDYLKKINIDLNDKKRGGGPTGLAVKTGKHVISNNIESDKRMLPWKNDAVKYGYKSSASFPIKVFGKVVGSFTLYSSQELFFDDEEINLLDEMVTDLSFALEFIDEEKVKREAEEKLKITQFGIDHSQIAVFQIDDDGKIYYANEQAGKSLGYTYEELTSMSVLDIDPTYSLKKWKEHRKNIHKKGSGTIETIHKRKDGTEFFVEVSINYFDYDGKKLTFSFAKDITKRKQAEEALSKSEENLSITLHSIGDAVISTDNKGIINKMNPTAEKLCGWKINDAIGNPLNKIFKIINADTRTAIDSPFEKVIKTGKVVGLANHTILISRNGTERNIADSAAPIKDYNGKIKGMVLVFSDVTEAYKMRNALSKSEDFNRDLVENSDMLMCTHDLNGNLLSVNKTACQITGYSSDELLGMNLTELIVPEYRKYFRDYIDKIQTDGRAEGLMLIKNKKGEYRNWKFNNSLRTEGVTKPIVRGLVRDITEQKRAEDALHKSEALFHSVWDSSKDSMRLTDENGRMVKVNQEFCDFVKKPREELEGKLLIEIYIDSEREQILNSYINNYSIKELMPYLERKYKLWNGDEIWLAVTTSFLNVEHPHPLVLSIFRNITERKQAEKQIQESEKQLRTLVEGTKALLFTTDNRGRITYFNTAGSELLGISPNQLLGSFYLRLVSPDDRQRVHQHYLKQLKDAKTSTYLEFRYIKKNNEVGWVSFSVNPLITEGNTVGLTGVALDITERKLAEEALSKSRKEFKSYFDSGSIGLSVTAADKTWIEINQRLCEMFGYSKEELSGFSWDSITYPEDLAENLKLFQQALDGKIDNYETDKRFIRKDGSIIYTTLSVVCQRNEDGTVNHFLSSYNDITERKRAEEELSNERALLKNIIGSIPNPIYVKDLQGRRIIANQAAALFAGKKSVDEILGKTNFEIFSFDYAEKSRIEEEEIIKTGKPLENFEKNFTTTDGKKYWYIGSKVFLKDSKGNPFGILAVNLDISDRKLMEEQLLEKENQMRMIVEGTPQMFFYTQDVNSKVTYISPSVKEITGRPVEEWLNQSHWYITNNEINEYAKQKTHSHLRGELTEGPILVEVEHVDKHPIVLEVYESPIIKNNKVIGLQGVAHDISERKRAEKILRESEERFRNLIENINEVFYISNGQGRIEYCSPNSFTSIGYTLQDVLGKSYIRLVAPIDRRLVIDHYFAQTAKGVSNTQLIFRVRCKDGKIIWVEQITNIVRDTSGKVVGFRNVARDISPRIQAQEKLRESEEKFRSLVESINEVFYISDEKGIVKYCSPNNFAATGYSQKDIIGKSYIRVVAPIDRRKVVDHYLKAANEGAIDTILEYRVIRKDGTIIWVEQNNHIVHDSEGNIVEFRNVSRDITDRKQSEEELRKSKEELQKFFEEDISADFITTAEGKLLRCNKTFLRMFGFSSTEEAMIYPIEKLYLAPSNRDKFLEMLKKNKKVENMERELVTHDGRTLFTIENAVGVFNENGELIQIRGYIVDITKRKIAEEELKKQSRAVEQSPASVVITNQDGDIEYVNKKFSETTGYSKKEVIGKNPRILKSGQQDKKFYEELWNNILQGKEWKGEMRNKKKNGDLFWESVLISPLVNNEGDITHFVAVKEDITEKEMMVVELINAKEKAESANKLKDAFIANISHEIRSPLNGILGLTSIIKDIYAEHIKEGEDELFVGIDRSSNRLIRTVDMILNYSRIQTGEFPVTPKKLELSSICENLVKEFNTAAKGRKLELSFKNKIDKKVMIFGDEYSITHSISNLIDNAIKYTNKGFVNIILYNGDDDEVLLDVKDSGIGISEGYIQHIFEPYQQEQMGYGRAYEGVGLGLPIVKKFLGLNKAGISVESKKGEGTTFTINFGKSIKSTVEKLTEEKIIKNVLSQERENKPLVLLVEDDAINQSTVKRFIDVNYNTVVTDNSERALEILKTNRIDLILMDISIKGNKNGLELTKELKSSKEYSNIPVIAITAHAFDTDRQNSLQAGCDDYLSKPFSKKLLLETIGKFI